MYLHQSRIPSSTRDSCINTLTFGELALYWGYERQRIAEATRCRSPGGASPPSRQGFQVGGGLGNDRPPPGGNPTGGLEVATGLSAPRPIRVAAPSPTWTPRQALDWPTQAAAAVAGGWGRRPRIPNPGLDNAAHRFSHLAPLPGVLPSRSYRQAPAPLGPVVAEDHGTGRGAG